MLLFFCRFRERGLGPDPGPSAVLGFWDTASGQWTLRSLAPELWPVLLWLHLWWWVSGGGNAGVECLPTGPPVLTWLGPQRSRECSPEDKPVTEFTVPHTLIQACDLRVRLFWLEWAAWVPDVPCLVPLDLVEPGVRWGVVGGGQGPAFLHIPPCWQLWGWGKHWAGAWTLDPCWGCSPTTVLASRSPIPARNPALPSFLSSFS